MTIYYIPIKNLIVEKEINIGKVSIYPSSMLIEVQAAVNSILEKSNNYESYKNQVAPIYEDINQQFFHESSVAKLTHDDGNYGELIPKDTSFLRDEIQEVLAFLYLFQKQLTKRSSVEHQVFGLESQITQSLDYIVALRENQELSYKLSKVGVYSDWTFFSTQIDDLYKQPLYKVFNKALSAKVRSDIENRIISSALWLHDAALDYNQVNRFVKITTALEVLFAPGDGNKSFRLSRFSALLSHLYLFKDIKCSCPILKSHSMKEYLKMTKEQNLPGECSAFWDMHRWYTTRCEIVHDAKRYISKTILDSYEWHAHALVGAVIEIVSNHETTITNTHKLQIFLENKYELKIASLLTN